MTFKNLSNALRICLGCMLVLTALSATSYAGLTAVPEVDPGMAGGAVALLAGGYLLFVSKVRRKQ